MTQNKGVPPAGSGYSAEPGPISVVPAVPVSIPNAAFTNADFARVVSKLAARLSSRAADLAYGMWNPGFCSAEAAGEAETFFATMALEATHWQRRAASAIEARRAETHSGSVHESAGPKDDAQQVQP